MDGLRIDRLPDGGFVVSEASPPGRCLKACSEIGDALGYIGDKLDPVEKASEGVPAVDPAMASGNPNVDPGEIARQFNPADFASALGAEQSPVTIAGRP